MKKTLSKFIAAALVLVLALSLVGFAPADAAETPQLTTSASPATEYLPYDYHHASTDYCKTFTGEEGNQVIVESYIDRVVLVGFGKGIKKINKTLKTIARYFYNDYGVDGIYEYAQAAVEGGVDKEIYFDYVYMGVTYMGTKYVSIDSSFNWYAGGVTNIMSNGLVFDLKTGKKKTITAVTGLKEAEIKSKLIETIKKSGMFGDFYDEYADKISEYVDSLTAKDINFIINREGKIVIIVPPYTDPFFGGASIEFVLDDVYVAE